MARINMAPVTVVVAVRWYRAQWLNLEMDLVNCWRALARVLECIWWLVLNGRMAKKKMSRSPERRSRSRSSRSKTPEVRSTRRRRSRTYSASPELNVSKRLHIAGIDDSVRRRDIEDAFGRFGKLEDIWVASYPPYYAFVVYEQEGDAVAALKELRSGYVRDCRIRVSIALPRNSGRRGPPPPPRRYEGGGGGRGGGGGGGGGDRGRRGSPYGRRTPPRSSHRRSGSPPARRSRSPRRRRRSSTGSSH